MSAVPSVPFSMTTKSGRIYGICFPLRLSFLFFFSLFLIFYDERSNIQSLSSDWKLERRYLLGRGKVFHFIIFLYVHTFSMLWCWFACLLFLNSFKDKLKDFLEKKEKGELLIQKAGNLLQNILKKVCETGWNKLTQIACFMELGIETRIFHDMTICSKYNYKELYPFEVY